MDVLRSILIAFSMFSAVPVPQTEWDERGMRMSLCAFPLVGVMIALCCRGWESLCLHLSIPPLMQGAGLCLIPVWLTGGIHLDGYADTCDALASHAGRERMQEILKDPHLGAFAAIRLCVYMIASFVLWCTAGKVKLTLLLGIFGLSRSLSGLSLTMFPLRPGSGLARSFAEAADRKTVRTVLFLMAAAFGAALIAAGAWLSLLAAVAVFLYYRLLCDRKFGGLSGDLAGWFLQEAEIWMLGMLVLSRFLEVLT